MISTVYRINSWASWWSRRRLSLILQSSPQLFPSYPTCRLVIITLFNSSINAHDLLGRNDETKSCSPINEFLVPTNHIHNSVFSFPAAYDMYLINVLLEERRQTLLLIIIYDFDAVKRHYYLFVCILLLFFCLPILSSMLDERQESLLSNKGPWRWRWTFVVSWDSYSHAHI